MAVDQELFERVQGLLSPIDGLEYRDMFGGFGVYQDADMFGMISRSPSTLSFKVGDLNREDFISAGCPRFGLMPYYQVPERVLDDSGTMQEWAALAVEVGHLSKIKKRVSFLILFDLLRPSGNHR